MQRTDVDFSYYYNQYCKGKKGLLNREDFDRFAPDAARRVEDYITCGDKAEQFTQQIKNCICRVAEELFRFDLPFDISSETVDGYSVTYRDVPCINDGVRQIVTASLGDTGLLFRGVE